MITNRISCLPKPATKSGYSPCLLLAVVLGGCNASMPNMPELPFTKPDAPVISGLVGDQTNGRITLRDPGIRVPRSTAKLEAPNSVVLHEQTTAYLRDILAQLVAQVPPGLESDKEVDVYITSHTGSVHFYATGDNDILVGYGALTSLKSRDELAFALAHELAHIILGHNDSQESILSMDTTVKLVDEGLMLANAYETVINKNPDGPAGGTVRLTADEQREYAQHVARIQLSASAIRSSITGVLQGAWSRSQEREADRLGYDLLVAAGFNGEGAGRVLDRLAVEPSLRENVGQQVDMIESSANSLVALSDRNSVKLYIKQMGISAAAIATKEILAAIDDTHKAAAERKRELYVDYVDELDLPRNLDRRIDEDKYSKDLQRTGFPALAARLDKAQEGYKLALTGDVTSKDGAKYTQLVSGPYGRIGFNRYAMYSLRKASGNSQTAVKNLELAWRNRPEDYATTVEYASVVASRSGVGKALEVIEYLERTYPSDAPLNDVRGRLYAETGDIEKAKQLWLGCDINRKAHIRARCEAELWRVETAEQQLAMEQQMLQTTQVQQPVSTTGEVAQPESGLEKLKSLFKNTLQ